MSCIKQHVDTMRNQSTVLKEESNLVVVSAIGINNKGIEIYFKRPSNKQNGDWT